MLATLIEQTGWIFYPLACCSMLGLALVLERLIYFISFPVSRLPGSSLPLASEQLAALVRNLPRAHSPHALAQPLSWLMAYRTEKRVIREELASQWLADQHQSLHSHLQALNMIGIVAPLLGLLGTILGLITMFQSLATSTDPVTPALIAAGLWNALYTTALGLIIAIPALLCSHGFSLWADRRLASLERDLNRFNLALEGINTSPNSNMDVPLQGQIA